MISEQNRRAALPQRPLVFYSIEKKIGPLNVGLTKVLKEPLEGDRILSEGARSLRDCEEFRERRKSEALRLFLNAYQRAAGRRRRCCLNIFCNYSI